MPKNFGKNLAQAIAETRQAQAMLAAEKQSEDGPDLPQVPDQVVTVTADVSAAQSSLHKVTGDAEKLNKTTGGTGKFLETFLAGSGSISIIKAETSATLYLLAPLSRRSAAKTENLFQHFCFARFAKALYR